MRILITGNLGYLGPCVTGQLRAAYPGARLIGVDTGYFAGCVADHLAAWGKDPDEQIFADLRNLPAGLFSGVDSVVHLAALSNDPIGSRFETATNEINFSASMEIARKAMKCGARSFVFASSCSVYGTAEETPRAEKSEVNPLTAYARSKVAVEYGLKALAGNDFTVTCLRFATACGMSPRLRLDLVLNDFVASATSIGRVRVQSNGLPWRPLIHVKDMARAIEWAVSRDSDHGGKFLVMNTGSDAMTYRVSELAAAVASCVPGAQISINRNAPADNRSYKADFSLFRRLAPHHQPREQLAPTILELKESMERLFRTGFPEPSRFIRLRTLTDLVELGRLDSTLRWVHATERTDAVTQVPEFALATQD